MGFLSKLFGGDADAEPELETTRGERPPSPSPEREPKSAVSVRPSLGGVLDDAFKPDGDATDRAVPAVRTRAPAQQARPAATVASPPKRTMDSGGTSAASTGTAGSSPSVGRGKAGSGARNGGGATAPFKSRRERKSPGYYSSLSPEQRQSDPSPGVGLQPVKPGVNLKKATVVGLAPPPPGANKTFTPPPEDKTSTIDLSRAAPPVKVDAAAAAPPVERRVVRKTPASIAQPEPRSHEPVPAPPSSVVLESEEPEKTSPGLGTTRSRHDPEVLLALPTEELALIGEFVVDVALGPASERWLAPIRTAVVAIRAAAQAAKRAELDKALALFEQVLEGDGELSGERRKNVLHRFVAVDIALPQPFDVAQQKDDRERLIVSQLIGQIGGMHPLLKKRIADEGFTALDRFVGVKPADLRARLDSDREQAEQLVSTFQGYMLQRCERGPDVALQGGRKVLTERLGQLEEAAADFQRASDEDDAAAKRKARRQRQSRVAGVNLLLAELGEGELLDQIERCSVRGKIERLRSWLDDTSSSD